MAFPPLHVDCDKLTAIVVKGDPKDSEFNSHRKIEMLEPDLHTMSHPMFNNEKEELPWILPTPKSHF